MDLGLDGRHVLVTGASRGIGFACVQAFLAEGAKVTMLSRDDVALRAAAQSLVAAGRVAWRAADLRDPAAALAALDAIETAFGPLDVLVNCAGAAKRRPPGGCSPMFRYVDQRRVRGTMRHGPKRPSLEGTQSIERAIFC